MPRNQHWLPTKSGSVARASEQVLSGSVLFSSALPDSSLHGDSFPNWLSDQAWHIPCFASLCVCSTFSPKGIPDTMLQIQYHSRLGNNPKALCRKIAFSKKASHNSIPHLSISFQNAVSLSCAGVYSSLLEMERSSGPWEEALCGSSPICMFSSTPLVLCSMHVEYLCLPAYPWQPKPLPLRKHPASTGKQGQLAYHIALEPSSLQLSRAKVSFPYQTCSNCRSRSQGSFYRH